MAESSSQGCPFLQVYISRWAEGNTAQEVTHKNEAPELLTSSKLVLANTVKCNPPPLYIHCSDTAAKGFPHCNADSSLSPFAELIKFLELLKRGGGSKIRERLSKITPRKAGFWSFLAPLAGLLLRYQRQCGSKQWRLLGPFLSTGSPTAVCSLH